MPVERMPRSDLTGRLSGRLTRTSLGKRGARRAGGPASSHGARALVEHVRRDRIRVRGGHHGHRRDPDVPLRPIERHGRVRRAGSDPARPGGVEGVRVDAAHLVRGAGRPAAPAGPSLGRTAAARSPRRAAPGHLLHRRVPQAATGRLGAPVPDLHRRARRRLERVRPSRRHALGNGASHLRGHPARHPGGRDVAEGAVLRRALPRAGHREPLPDPRRRRAGVARGAHRGAHRDPVPAEATAVRRSRTHGGERGGRTARSRRRPRAPAGSSSASPASWC